MGSSSNEKRNSPGHVKYTKITTTANSTRQRINTSKTSIVCWKVHPSKIYTTQNWAWVANQLTGFYAMNSLLYKTCLEIKIFFIQKPDKRNSSTFIKRDCKHVWIVRLNGLKPHFYICWSRDLTIALCLVMALVLI